MIKSTCVIFTSCYGKDFLPLLPLWHNSVRAAGGFQGRVIVMTDDAITVSALIPDIEAIARPPVSSWKAGLLRKIEDSIWMDQIGSFDVALFCDVDVLFVKSTAALFERNEGAALLMSLGTLTIGDSSHAAYYDPLAMCDRRIGFNSGVYRFRRHASELLVWSDECRKLAEARIPNLGDQTVLNYLFWKQAIEVSAFPREWVCYPRRGDLPNTHTVLVHYAGFKGIERIGRMMRDAKAFRQMPG